MPAAPASDVFDEQRSTLFGVAYRVLGSVADAEDVIQNAWLRWQSVDHSKIENPDRFLVRVTARLAIDELRSARSRRESYVGEWLPEPLMVQPDAAERAATAESVSLAMLLVLESLTPVERVVFVLREVFDYPYAEIAEAIGVTEAAARQTGMRARSHVQDRQSRYDVDPLAQRTVVEAFLAACEGGDVEALLSVLSPDVVLISDGGGLAQAPRKPIVGAEMVARALVTFAGRPPADPTSVVVDINGEAGVVVYSRKQPAVAVGTKIVDGKIVELYLVANPEKLGGLTRLT
jgi:RNA polymerase sigma-70 factor (ECF subfamily)